jgi:alkylation response protein AidB-like acyl-CoA dehydrogenase
MDFGLNEQQRAMQESFAAYLDNVTSVEKLRASLAEGPVHDLEIWQGIVDMGLTGLLVPEAYGGLGLSLLDAVLVQELLGSRVAPVAYAPAAVLATVALVLAGSETQKEQWLPAIVRGNLQVAVGLSDAGGVREGAVLTSRQGKLSGRLLLVEGAPDAQLLICSCDEGDIYAIPREAAGLEWVALRTIDDTRCHWEVNLQEVKPELLSAAVGDVASRLLSAGRILHAADTLGAAQSMLDKAVAYAGERQQFGRLIGSFQAVKHLCAEMAAELEPCRALLWYAAHAYDTAPAEHVMIACHAKAHLSETGSFIARTATEVHGGMGFTELLGLHYWFKRIGCNRQLLGGPDRLREEAAHAQGWGLPPSRIALQGGGYR